jgi:hypothetical protein
MAAGTAPIFEKAVKVLGTSLAIGDTTVAKSLVLLPIGSGHTTVARVEAMATLSPTLGYLVIPTGYTLKVGCVATMTTGTITDVVAMGGDY